MSLLWVEGERREGPPFDADPASLWGHFAVHLEEGGKHLLGRDRLGVQKLFFARTEDGGVDTDRLLQRLLARQPAERVFSAPSGDLLVLEGERTEKRAAPPLAFAREGTWADAVPALRAAWETTLGRLAEAFAGRPVYVTLSGGLDSSTVAALAAEHFPDLRALTFRLDGPDEGPVREGDDLHAARRVAAHLGLPLREVSVDGDAVLALLGEALVHGQDWRDFNVHCALVNAALAQALEGEGAAVLTGDGANELLADYTAVELEGRTYYELPRLPRSVVRRFLVRGLDAGDREVGVFARWGTAVAQPYLLAAEAYAMLPDAFVDDREAKAELARALVRGRLPELVFTRPKVRAQCGREGEPGGTLALAARAGIDQEALLERFARLHGVDVAWSRRFIHAGLYRRLPANETPR
ncbi:MAG TPA: asparagine synthase-related protein [Polyangiaceae bacterium LLY-WYZ-15_(1-7)]|nr:asparagine synthase-related protein [Polyangiaceae bacterium LLY-WYZ-15_(1-7)]HJL05554.1 asparagine synthase-related protein [Polyangiaceae bacterium LLY-WYZ-15_(1-7)]HJL10766.1 asparagine synthase-related protein [Polyangiaceae bacterium LLY-WYZ-15_(1-7)]HJL27406.1 asparagine synthase-related protein [Polyangiaceae bacterium LLY-WYZ-15_(1-7)]HJL34982.1 asparagine synthase-related protein [Polyangiaceae bacterium LLY-WYZ-15_(1-7)]